MHLLLSNYFHTAGYFNLKYQFLCFITFIKVPSSLFYFWILSRHEIKWIHCTNVASLLPTADILVYINDVCVLGMSHKEVVEMLKSVPMGHGVEVEVRRGYPMLYNHDGVLKQPHARLGDSRDPLVAPTTTQPQPRLPTPTALGQHYTFNGIHSDGDFLEPALDLDPNGNTSPYATRQPTSYRRLSLSHATSSLSPARPPRSIRSLARLQSFDPTLASQSDSEVVSAIGSHRYSNNLNQP